MELTQERVPPGLWAALNSARASQDEGSERRVLLDIAVAAHGDDGPGAESFVDTLIETAEFAGDNEVLAMAWCLRGRWHADGPEPSDGVTCFHRAASLFSDLGNDKDGLIARAGAVVAGRRDAQDLEAHFSLIREGRGAGVDGVVAAGFLGVAWARVQGGAPADALGAFQQAFALASNEDLVWVGRWAQVGWAEALLLLGRPDDATSVTKGLRKGLRGAGDELRGRGLAILATLASDALGSMPESLGAAAIIALGAAAATDVAAALVFKAAGAHAAKGNHTEAIAGFRAAAEIFRKAKDAAGAVDAELGVARSMLAIGEAVKADMSIERAEQMAVADGSRTLLLRVLETARTVYRALGQLGMTIMVEQRLAHLADEGGDRDGAERHLLAAVMVASRNEDPRGLEAVDTLAPRLLQRGTSDESPEAIRVVAQAFATLNRVEAAEALIDTLLPRLAGAEAAGTVAEVGRWYKLVGASQDAFRCYERAGELGRRDGAKPAELERWHEAAAAASDEVAKAQARSRK